MVTTTRQHHLNPTLTVLVTGAASGIGAAQAQAFLQAGHHVFALDLVQADSWADWQQRYPGRFAWATGDVSNQAAVQTAVHQLIQQFGKLDVVCNTAGILDGFAKLEAMSLAQWQQVLAVNVTGAMLVTQAALPHLLAQPASRVINMASIASLTAGGGGIAYTTAKHALAGFTKQMAYDYATTGLRVNAIAPGAIQTAMTAADFEAEGELAQWVADQVPTKRWAQADEVAALSLFLASDAADYINGTIMPLDGGWLIR